VDNPQISPAGIFSAQIDLVGLDPNRTLEVEIAGPKANFLQHELATELGGIAGLEVHPVGRRAVDISQLVYLAGASGGIIQGIDVLWRWYSTKRQKGDVLNLTIRTTRGGELRLTATSLKEARRLLDDLQSILKE